jgi:hypothetical protein
MQYKSSRASPARQKSLAMPVYRENLGSFIDFKDGNGLRFVLNDEEIEWV